MKLLQTETRNGSPNGYFDPATGIHYEVDGERPFWVVALFPAGSRLRLSAVFNDYDDAKDELDRIAALISGETAPVGESWVEGPPPLTDGAWFVVVDEDRNIHVVQCVYPLAPKPWETAAGYPYASAEFTHHIPTPIQPPKETDE